MKTLKFGKVISTLFLGAILAAPAPAAVPPLDSTQYGSYVGMATDLMARPSNTMSVALNSNRTFTANILGIAGNGGWRGTFASDNTYGATVTIAGSPTRVDMVLALVGAEYVITGTTKSATSVVLSNFVLRRPLYSKTNATAPAGVYNFTAAAPVDSPSLGDFVSSGKVKADGSAYFRGYYPDGTSFSCSGRLGLGDTLVLGARSGRPTHTMLANLAITTAVLPALNTIAGPVRIYRPTVVTNTYYALGLDEVRAAIGSLFLPPAYQQMAAPWFAFDVNNVAINLINGQLDGTRLIGSWMSDGKLVAPLASSYALSGSGSNGTGEVWGSYKINTGRNTNLGITNNSSSFRGVILQAQNLVSGFYLNNGGSGRVTYTVPAPGETPAYTIVSPSSKSVSGNGQTYTVSVFTRGDWESTGGAWDVEVPADVTWLTATIDGAGIDDDTVTVVVDPNDTNFSRSTTITIAGYAHRITQGPRPTTISPASKSVTAAGATYLVSVNTIGEISADVVTGDTWITATPDDATHTVEIVVAANPDNVKRVGTVNIAGRIHTITQSPVSITFTPSKSPYISANGGSYDIKVTANAPWAFTIPTADTWVTAVFTASASDPNSGILTVTVGAYTTGTTFPVERNSYITISGKKHYINQDWKYSY